MTILHKKEIKEALKNCSPTHIAVAFIGEDWKEYITDTNRLEVVIVSPSFGTNPYAFCELADEIGWEKIFILNGLHSKIYLGKNSAIVGSANLSNNGLNGENRTETCVEITEQKDLTKLGKIIKELKEDASEQCKSEKDKRKEVDKIRKLWEKSIRNGIVKEKKKKETIFENYNVKNQGGFYVSWGKEAEIEYTGPAKDIECLIKDFVCCREDDVLEKNKWVLMWVSHDNGESPDTDMLPYWLYIDKIFPNGAEDNDEYSKLVIDLNGQKYLTPPFKITQKVAAAFFEVMDENEEIKKVLSNDYIAPTKKIVPNLIKKMKEKLSNRKK